MLWLTCLSTKYASVPARVDTCSPSSGDGRVNTTRRRERALRITSNVLSFR